MSEEQHQDDIDNKLNHDPSSASDGSGGACLNRHLQGRPKNNSCSHPWQAYLKMLDDNLIYDWDKYEVLSKRKTRIPTVCQWGPKTLTQPAAHDWDVMEGTNFRDVCYKPYFHEAHHIVPNSVLRNTLVEFVKGVNKGETLIKKIRGGLLDEKYNLNYKNNMVMLPLDKAIADALNLPRHRKRASDFNHSVYSKHVTTELKKIFSGLKQELVDHKKPKYKNLKDQIEALSVALYPNIVRTAAGSLDDMEQSEFDVVQPIP
jgi:hypothetical protein